MNKNSYTLKISMIFIGLISAMRTPAVTEEAVNFVFNGAAVLGTIVAGGTSFVALKDNKDFQVCMTPLAMLVSYSCMKGLQNMRQQQQILVNIENKYGFKQQYGFFQLPGVVLRDAMCCPVEDTVVAQLDPFMVAVKNKVLSLKVLHPLAVWDFGMFTHFNPHTDLHGVYAVSVNYFQEFGSSDIKGLKDSVNQHIKMIEDDFDVLKQMTSLWSFGSYAQYGLKIPKTQAEYLDLVDQLNQLCQRKYMALLGGVFGYSPLHNAQRVVTAMAALVEYRMYLVHLRDFLLTCVQDDVTIIQNTSGHLSFLVQHVHFVQEKK